MKDTKQKTKNVPVKRKGSSFGKVVNKLMPYILSVIAAIFLFSLTGLAGNIGNSIKNILNGVFSNFATYFFPFIIIYHAIVWNYDIKRGICVRRVVCSIVALMCLSSVQYLIEVGNYEELNSYNITAFYDLGVTYHGGGVVGGLVGRVLLNIGNVVVPMLIVLVLLAFMILQMFNITPAQMVRSAFDKKKKTQEKPQEKKPESKEKTKPIKHKTVKVIEDEDEDINEAQVAFLETTTVTLVDGKDDSDDELEETSKYEKLDTRAIIMEEEEKLPSQFQPYDESKKEEIKTEYNKTHQQAPEEFKVTTTKLGEDNYSDVSEKEYDKEYTEEPSSKIKTEEEPVFASEPKKEIIPQPEVKEEKKIVIEVSEETEDEETTEIEEDEKIEENAPQDYTKYISREAMDKMNPKAQAPEEKFKVVATPVVEKKVEEPKPKREVKPKVNYKMPPIDLLQSQPESVDSEKIQEELQENARIIVETLNNFKAGTKIVDVTRGPTITRYELLPEPGVRVRTIEGLADDIALNLAAKGIRVECPIPGKRAVGIEVPNKTISFVYLRDLIEDPEFKNAKSKLTCALGKSISGENVFADIESTPHLLVAGATGMGKSVCINSLLVSLLYNATPDDVRLILIDPKRVELSNYNGIPHLLVPVVCEPKKSLGALQWAVTEMDQRFETIEEAGVRNIKEFNAKVEKGYDAEKMPRIVIVIDELADLKMAVPDIEGHITRLTQKARAAGIHIIIGTQRPSVDVLTGLIKNNIPSRIAFRVPSQIDSRTILDEQGAEKLVSKGDMLVKLVGSLAPVRVQGAYVSVDEIQDVIDFWKEHAPANYDEAVMQQIDNNAAKLAKNDKEFDDGTGSSDSGDLDSEFYNALSLAVDLRKISSSLLMRKLQLGFQRASRIIDQLEECGYIGEANGSKPRETLITVEEYQEIMMRRNDE